MFRQPITVEFTGSRFEHNEHKGELKGYGQYNHLYLSRLQIMRPLLLEEAKKRWAVPNLRYTEKIIDSETSQGEEFVLIGTLYKEMQLKPSVLDEFKDFANISSVVKPLQNYTSGTDFLILEDDSGRVRLRGLEHIADNLVTGITLALRGQIDDTGIFQVRISLPLYYRLYSFR